MAWQAQIDALLETAEPSEDRPALRLVWELE